MRTAALKLRRGIANAQVVSRGDLNRRVLFVLLACVGTLAVFYVLFLGKMVYNIVERKSLENEARTLANEVGELELSYLSASEQIDLELSKKMGFREISPKYATRKSLGSLPMVKNEI